MKVTYLECALTQARSRLSSLLVITALTPCLLSFLGCYFKDSAANKPERNTPQNQAIPTESKKPEGQSRQPENDVATTDSIEKPREGHGSKVQLGRINDVIVRCLSRADRPVFSELHYNQANLIKDIQQLTLKHIPQKPDAPVPAASWEIHAFTDGEYTCTINVYGPDGSVYTINDRSTFAYSDYWKNTFLAEISKHPNYYSGCDGK